MSPHFQRKFSFCPGRWNLCLLLALVFPGSESLSQSTQQAPQKQTFQTGPNVGQKIPTFRALDQDGREQTFETVRGPKGALLVFFRSADW